MRFTNKVVVYILLSLCFTSCIRDEALNAEADITACKVPTDILLRSPIITNDKVTFFVKDWVDLTQQAPEFTITDGATISPASGTTRDFTKPQTYTVTSQDKKWKKNYTVEYVFNELLTQYHFENTKYYTYTDDDTGKTKQFYQIFYDTKVDGNQMEWGSGNAGFMITNNDAAASEYPTSQADNGYEGKCAKLTTRSTGTFGAMFKAPIAAGNLFIGTFEINLTNMAKSTHFGVPFTYEPKGLVGYYKYKAGDTYTDASSKVIAGKKDDFDIYAVFYEVTKDVQYLDGTNSLTSDQIVSIARLTDKKETDSWTRFAIPFELKSGKVIDPVKLKNGQYNIAIIMSSSIDGANFNGAVGSTLYVDEMQLFYESK
jgi:hypothetical protein